MSLGIGIGLPFGGAPAAASSGGTSADRFSVMGTGFRWPTEGASHATNTYFVVEFRFATPDYAVTDPRVFCPSFFSPSSGGETLLAGGASIIVQGWSIETSSGVWTACDGAAEGGCATVTNANGGEWLPRVAATLSANTGYVARLTFRVSGTSVTIPRVTQQALPTSPLGQERMNGATTTWFARLTDNVAVTNSGGNGIFYKPVMMIAKGGDGRPAIIVVGDSIGYGSADSRAISNWSSRNEFGYVARGLDNNSGSQRLGYHIMCIPGQRAVGTGSPWTTTSNWAGKRNAVQQVVDAYGELPFDEVLCQHISNTVPFVGDVRAGFVDFYGLLWSKPITQIECLPAVTSSNGYADVGGQTPQSGYNYGGSGTDVQAWDFNADVGGVDGLGDASAYYRAGGYIIGSIAPWRYSSVDTSTQRDLWPVRPYSSTLSSAYVSGGTIVTTDAPSLGMALAVLLDSGSYGTLRDVTAVTGSGPYTVTLTGSLGGAAAAGKTVREVWGDNIHPSGLVHRDVLQSAITDWKVARGWV
jgi:hypothetical protein